MLRLTQRGAVSTVSDRVELDAARRRVLLVGVARKNADPVVVRTADAAGIGEPMTVVDLFSGIGGFALAARASGKSDRGVEQ